MNQTNNNLHLLMIAMVKRDWGIRGRKWGLEALFLEEISFRTGSEEEERVGILPSL